jgi:hypothetical protein
MEYSILKEFMARRGNLGARTSVFYYHINKYFMKKFNVERNFSKPYEFFEELLSMNAGVDNR